MNKTQRALRILKYLQDRKRPAYIEQLAIRFDCHPKTIRRTVRELREEGFLRGQVLTLRK